MVGFSDRDETMYFVLDLLETLSVEPPDGCSASEIC